MYMHFRDLPKVGRALPAILRANNGGALILEEARSDTEKGTVAVIRIRRRWTCGARHR